MEADFSRWTVRGTIERKFWIRAPGCGLEIFWRGEIELLLFLCPWCHEEFFHILWRARTICAEREVNLFSATDYPLGFVVITKLRKFIRTESRHESSADSQFLTLDRTFNRKLTSLHSKWQILYIIKTKQKLSSLTFRCVGYRHKNQLRRPS